jgi:inward rectifier potassium channel
MVSHVICAYFGDVAAPRSLTAEGRSTLVQYGLPGHWWDDAYHLFLTAPWWRVIAGIVALYLLTNLAFAAAYAEVGGVENLAHGDFAGAFFFSVQTIGTIGYGRLSPVSFEANVLVAIESLLGLLGFAMATGLLFAKFSRPTSRVLWSRWAVVTGWDGAPALLFRMANRRKSQIVEAQLSVALLLSDATVEGHTIRRIHDLRLVRSRSPFFALTWTAIHPLGADSPLASRSREELRAAGAEIVASLTGIDERMMQTVHARHGYAMDDIVWNARFADVIRTLPDGRQGVDYGKFHDVVPTT